MTPDLLLGIDVGTTYSKAAVVTLDGVERAHGRRPTRWERVPTGAEIHPDALFEGALGAARDALEAHPEGRVIGVGVTSMAETGALLDARGAAVTPAIAWHDVRGDKQAQAIEERFGEQEFMARTGRGPTRLCSLSKYLWLRANVGEAERGVRWLSVAEWVAHRLGGEQLAELSLAARTGFLDLRARTSWDEALEWADAPPALLPEAVPAGAPVGRAADVMPRAAGAVVTVAGLDHSAAAVGAGATEATDVFNSCGTAEALIRAVDPIVDDAGLVEVVRRGLNVDWHVLPGRMALISGFESGLGMQRVLDLLGVTDVAGRTRLELAALAVTPGADGMKVADVIADRASITGIPHRPTPAHLWRATLESIAALGARVLATIESVAGDTHRLVVTGGGARGEAVRAVKRGALGPFVEPRVEEAGARGAALLAGVAAGAYADVYDLPGVEWREDRQP